MIQHYANDQRPDYSISIAGPAVPLTSDVKTWGDVSAAWANANGMSGTSGNNTDFAAKCVVFGLSASPYSRWALAAYQYPQPGTPCIPVVATNSCQLVTTSTTLDHGEMTVTEVEGHIAKEEVLVQCGSEVDVAFSSAGGGELLLKNGEIKSTLTVADKPLGTTLPLTGGGNHLDITSELTAEKTITSGEFTGSQVLVMSIK